MRISTALVIFLAMSGCGGDDGRSTGVCSGQGWRDTCHFLLTCSAGRFELLCTPPFDPELESALADAGVELDGTVCACVVDEREVRAIPYDDAFCSDRFPDGDPDRDDSAAVVVGDLCGWESD